MTYDHVYDWAAVRGVDDASLHHVRRRYRYAGGCVCRQPVHAGTAGLGYDTANGTVYGSLDRSLAVPQLAALQLRMACPPALSKGSRYVDASDSWGKGGGDNAGSAKKNKNC